MRGQTFSGERRATRYKVQYHPVDSVPACDFEDNAFMMPNTMHHMSAPGST